MRYFFLSVYNACHTDLESFQLNWTDKNTHQSVILYMLSFRLDRIKLDMLKCNIAINVKVHVGIEYSLYMYNYESCPKNYIRCE